MRVRSLLSPSLAPHLTNPLLRTRFLRDGGFLSGPDKQVDTDWDIMVAPFP